MSEAHGSYYVPTHSKLPFFGAAGLFCLGYGSLNLLHGHLIGPLFFLTGSLILVAVMFAWFRQVISEDKAGVYDQQADRSFRWGMVWFIFSEICFFGIFFFVLFYIRVISVPAMAGHGDPSDVMTHLLLWPNFKDIWPLLINPNPAAFPGPKGTLHTWSIPALNTLILLSSAVTLTWAHWSLKRNQRKQLILGLVATVVLGVIFLGFQAHEYFLAHTVYGLKMSSGIYGSTFYMLTGFHAVHVTIGLIMLFVILLRCIRGHFTADDHFGFEASAWYWHFVDVVWLILFVFVYWI